MYCGLPLEHVLQFTTRASVEKLQHALQQPMNAKASSPRPTKIIASARSDTSEPKSNASVLKSASSAKFINV